MHYPKLIFLFFLSFQTLSSAQCPENIDVNTQEDLEELMLLYPDCENVPGDVYLKNFTDLSPLSGIVSIGGDLNPLSTFPLTNLAGLSSLTAVGNLKLYNADHLTSLNGLESLSHVEGEIHIQQENLENLNGLSGLTNVGGDFKIWNNPLLTNLAGLEALEEVGGYIRIWRNDALTSVDEMSSLQIIGDDLNIGENDALVTIDGFHALHTITDGLFIHSNDQLNAVYGFDMLTMVGQADISNAVNGLLEISCLNNVVEIGRLNIGRDCQYLFLDQLEKVTGDIWLQSANMTHLVGCDKLISVGGNMVIDIGMANLPDFPNLESIGGMLLFHSSDPLEVLDGFNKLRTIGVSQNFRGFEVLYQDQLTEISGFNQLEEVEGGFFISENALLESITGFQSLLHVQREFGLQNNPMLNDCSAFCSFLLNRDEALPTYVWQNGTDSGSPCWERSTLLNQCAYRPVTVQDVDLNYQFGKQKMPLQGALVELSIEGVLVQSATTDIEGVAEIRYDSLEEGIIYQLDVTFPEQDDELLVRYRYSKAELLDGAEVDFPLSIRKKISATTAALDSLKVQLQFLGGNADKVEIPGYDISLFLDFLNDWSVIAEDHDEVIESMLRVTLGAHHIHEYFLSCEPFAKKFAKVAYDMYVNMAALVSICKKTNGLERKFTDFVETEANKGNISFDGLFARASRKLLISTLNQGFMITKRTLLDPFMKSFGNSPEEQQFVATMQRLIFILENHILKPDSELLKATVVELVSQWLSLELIQHYYINYATQEYVDYVVYESLEMEGTFEEVFQHAQTTYTKTQQTNDAALFVADFYENYGAQVASMGDVLEGLSIAITLASAGSLIPVAGPMMKVGTGLKGVAGILSGANFLNYGERIVYLPDELGDIVSNLSRNPVEAEMYPDGILDSMIMDLSSVLDSLSVYQVNLVAALESYPLSSVSSTYLEMDQYYQHEFLPRYIVMSDIASHVAQSQDSTLRAELFDFTHRMHRFEMQYFILQLQLMGIHMDSTEISYRDSAMITIDEWAAKHDSLVDGFRAMYASGAGLLFGPYVSVRSVTVPDSLTEDHFEMQVTLENVGPGSTPTFEVDLVANENTTAYKLVNTEEVIGPYDSLELSLGEQVVLEFRVYVIDSDSSITLTIDIEGVDGNDLSVPVSFIEFDQLVNTVELNTEHNQEILRLFPNPAQNEFTIECLTDDMIRHVHVYRMTGQLVHKTNNHIVQVRGWEPGLYIVEVVMDEVTVIKKLVLH